MKLVQPIEITDARLLSTNVPEHLYPNYDAGYSYSMGARVHVIGSDIHELYESIVDDNLGNTPGTSPDKWVYVSTTNPRLMFDRSVTTQTLNPDLIDVELQTTGRIRGLALFNVSAREAQVTVTDEIDGEVYDRTVSLVSDSGVSNWYDYFFEPVIRLSDLVLVDLPAYAAPRLRIQLRGGTDEEVACGTVAVGSTTDFGATQYGAEVGIQDFSIKDQDDWGNYSIIQRAYRKRATFTVSIPAVKVDATQQLLASLRSTPVVYIGADSYSSTAIYGFYKDFTIEIAYPLYSICSIEIEGLT